MLQKYKKMGLAAAACTLLGVGAANAAVVVFTPTGGNIVSQSTNIYWDMLSNQVSTGFISGAPGGSNLSDHGDFHFDGGTFSITEGTIAFGGLIDASSAWTFGESNWFVGTTDYGGTMTPPATAFYGVRFLISGQTHYGWVNITEGVSDQSINSWGYESTPVTGILAGAGLSAVPEPTSVLGTAGLLASGLMIRRRKLGRVLG